jgi:beta-glucosidase
VLTDGPHGVRLQAGETDHLGLNEAVPATCFPTASALAATWDRDLVAEVGRRHRRRVPRVRRRRPARPRRQPQALAAVRPQLRVLSEDPLVAGELAAAFIDGVQSRGVGTSLKHFAGNDQETPAAVVDAVYDDRTLRELELTAFEIPVTRARPGR